MSSRTKVIQEKGWGVDWGVEWPSLGRDRSQQAQQLLLLLEVKPVVWKPQGVSPLVLSSLPSKGMALVQTLAASPQGPVCNAPSKSTALRSSHGVGCFVGAEPLEEQGQEGKEGTMNY